MKWLDRNPETATDYQIFITFDLESAESSDYKDLHDKLEKSLGFSDQIKVDGGVRHRDLPRNILATVIETKETAEEFKKYIEQKVKEAFEEIETNAHYVVIISDKASVILKK